MPHDVQIRNGIFSEKYKESDLFNIIFNESTSKKDLVQKLSLPRVDFLPNFSTNLLSDLGLIPLTNKSVMKLADYPTLFLSPTYTAGRGEKKKIYIDVKVVDLVNIAVNGNEVTYSISIDADYGKVKVSCIEELSSALELTPEELEDVQSRWFLNKGDKNNFFKALNLSPPLSLIITNRVLGGINPPEHEVITDFPEEAVQVLENDNDQKIIYRLEEFLTFILGEKNSTTHETFYRGHSNQKYLLAPSILRKAKITEDGEPVFTHLDNEKEIISEMLTVQPGEFATDKSMLDKLVRMQHFGLPTRLLDLTYNPLIALYFACENHDDIDGEVIILKTLKTTVKFFDSDKVSCITNLCKLDKEQKLELAKNIDIAIKRGDELPFGIDNPSEATKVILRQPHKDEALKEFNSTNVCGHLLHSIKDEKPYFKDIVSPYHLGEVVFVRGRISNTRISSQAGSFLVFGLDASLPEEGNDDVQITRLTIKDKATIRKQLEILNIHASTVYPGLEKSAQDIKNKYQAR